MFDERGASSIEAMVAGVIIAICLLSVAGGLGSAAHAAQYEAGQDTVRDIVSSVSVDQEASSEADPANAATLAGAARTSWTVAAAPSGASAAGTVTLSANNNGSSLAITGLAQNGAQTVSQSVPLTAIGNP